MKTKVKWYTGACVLLVIGCGPVWVAGPDGLGWLEIRCNHSQSVCLDQAKEVCPNGYIIGAQSGSNSTETVGYGHRGGLTVIKQVYDGRLLIRCTGK